MKRIAITMCHGINSEGDIPLTVDRFERYFGIAREMGFKAITYDDLAEWRSGSGSLPDKPIMFDFDHPVKSISADIFPVMKNFGYVGNMFIDTRRYDMTQEEQDAMHKDLRRMSWDNLRELMDNGWNMGAHTHSHPDLSELSVKDTSGALVRSELEKCDGIIEAELGIKPKDFAYTSTTWSSKAEEEVQKRYRFGRLWIIGNIYRVDGKEIRYADLVGVAGDDESDGGPPQAARYITKETHPYRLPSMELQYLLYEYDAYKAYLEGALREE